RSSGNSRRSRRNSSHPAAFASAPSRVRNHGTNVAWITAPDRPASSRTSSVTFLDTSQRDRALECEKTTGAPETAIAERIVSSEVCETSTSMPLRVPTDQLEERIDLLEGLRDRLVGREVRGHEH